MQLTPTKSSNVLGVGYSGTTLTVQFKSGTYDYFDVSAEKWAELQTHLADEKQSVGAWISANIVKNHKFKRQEAAQ
jgi:hypothetical protein